jgi:IS5 family transposase
VRVAVSRWSGCVLGFASPLYGYGVVLLTFALSRLHGRQFCRIPLDGAVPHPTTLIKLTTRCGSAAVDGLNEVLLVKAVEAKLLPTTRIGVDTTVAEADVAYATDSGLLAKGIGAISRDAA